MSVSSRNAGADVALAAGKIYSLLVTFGGCPKIIPPKFPFLPKSGKAKVTAQFQISALSPLLTAVEAAPSSTIA